MNRGDKLVEFGVVSGQGEKTGLTQVSWDNPGKQISVLEMIAVIRLSQAKNSQAGKLNETTDLD